LPVTRSGYRYACAVENYLLYEIISGDVWHINLMANLSTRDINEYYLSSMAGAG